MDTAIKCSALLPVVRISVALIACGYGCSACGNELPERLAPGKQEGKRAPEQKGKVVNPPFEVRGELEGLLLVWFDERGLHTAAKRSDIPEGRRTYVRVDSLQIPPHLKLDQEFVYVADLRAPGKNGAYTVVKQRRDWFEALVDRESGGAQGESAPEGPEPGASAPGVASGRPPGPAASGGAASDVVLYTAAWCSACRAARSFLQKRAVPFVERDIEKDRAAYGEMQRKARAAGVRPGGLPLIDFRGRILTGFDPAQLGRLIAAGTPSG
jgi:glutaredoxin